MSQLKLSKETWSSQSIFILAAVGSAVGLGNLWKFPYITGEYGGSAFLLVYLLCVLLVGLPLLIAEITLGRAGQANPVQGMANLARENKASKLWSLLGLNGVLAAGFILSFYSVIAGWSGAYFVSSLQGNFISQDVATIQEDFSALLSSPWQLVFWHTAFSLLAVWIVSRGIKNGLEKAINILMPALFAILLILLGYVVASRGFEESVTFLFQPDFSKLTAEAVLVAMGHAFFTLSLGLGVMMVYGSYLNQQSSIVKASIWIAVADTAIALLAGVIIFSIVFGNNLDAASGPGLLFQTLPVAFSEMWGGWFFGTLFFGLVVLAALSSAISLIEPAVSWFEQNWGIQRNKAAWGFGFVTWVLGIGTVLSFNTWSDIYLFSDKTFFDSLDFLTANIMLPAGGFFMAIFVGWVLSKEKLKGELGLQERTLNQYRITLRWIVPVLVMIVFIYNLI
ncbi:sodium-dependent transporter [Thiomicrorhabdus indica]|uniref:sodium-dependent transporter n=1 Tax=Thiomicrorhabdus indica TaxID=2267253 RepID=UPI002AA8ABB9|nr:sodium-dependent transporter [Thiomicrorhabdus indica]